MVILYRLQSLYHKVMMKVSKRYRDKVAKKRKEWNEAVLKAYYNSSLKELYTKAEREHMLLWNTKIYPEGLKNYYEMLYEGLEKNRLWREKWTK